MKNVWLHCRAQHLRVAGDYFRGFVVQYYEGIVVGTCYYGTEKGRYLCLQLLRSLLEKFRGFVAKAAVLI